MEVLLVVDIERVDVISTSSSLTSVADAGDIEKA
jgi:hypothetical protein